MLKYLSGGVVSVGSAWLLTNKSYVWAKSQRDEDAMQKSNPYRIAIIGAGIGGSSAAYYLRSLLPDAEIDVYEQSDVVGGRLAVVEIGGSTIECGGMIIHDKNRYMVNFINESGLERNPDTNFKFGLYDGEKFLFTQTEYSWLNIIKLIWRYGPMNLRKMNRVVEDTLTKFDNIYSLQDQGNSYETVEELLKAMGGDLFVDHTKMKAKDVLKSNGISDQLIDELINAAVRVNYGQETSVNAFTGLVALAGIQGGKLFNVRGGNYKVCEKLLSSSKANIIHNKQILSINKLKVKDSIGYELDYADKETSKYYDSIIVAAPLEVPNCYIKCNNCSDWPKHDPSKRYQRTVATFLQAYLKYKRLGFENKTDAPNAIMTTSSPNLSFSSIGQQRDINAHVPEIPIYKIFSPKKLTDKQISEVFEFDESTPKVVVSWLAYPKYSPPEEFVPFKLDKGVFYVNAIERGASAMEMSAIGGRNVALLTKKYFDELSH